jgi:hypothetical protein
MRALKSDSGFDPQLDIGIVSPALLMHPASAQKSGGRVALSKPCGLACPV